MPLKGYKKTKEHLEKISKSWFKKGYKGGNQLGKHWKIKDTSKMNLDKLGRNHPNWRGGTNSKTRTKYAPRPKPERCEVCGKTGRICYDHDHKTGKFRGWICLRCNFALGYVKDNSEILVALSEYIKKHQI